MSLTFEWDEQKAEQNLEKHGVSFQQASEVFSDPLSAMIPDATHSERENRLLAIGQSANGQVLLVVFAERESGLESLVRGRRRDPKRGFMKKAKTKKVSKENVGNGKTSAVKPAESEDEMRDDYSFLDWSKAERGKYAKRYAESTNVVLIAPDVLDVFPDAESINRALRTLADLIRAASAPKSGRGTTRRHQ